MDNMSNSTCWSRSKLITDRIYVYYLQKKLDLIRERQVSEFEVAIQEEKPEEEKRKGKQPIIQEKPEEKKVSKTRKQPIIEDTRANKRPRKA
jgi:hypothetical protein